MAYAFRRQITVGAATGGTQTNFPVLIKLDSSNCGTTMKTAANGGRIQNTVTQSGGNAVTMPADLIFTSDAAGTTKIPWEVESYDATNGILWAWVLIASLTTGTNTIYAQYDDATVSTQQNTGSFAPSAVWNSNFKGVWHLPNGTTLLASDSTGLNSGATINNSPTATPGQIDGGASFTGTGSGSSSQNINLGNGSATQIVTNTLTISCWVKFTAFNNGNVRLFAKQIVSNVSPFINYGLYCPGTTGKVACFISTGGTGTQAESDSAVLSTGTWYHVVGIYDGSNIKIFVNAAQSGSSTAKSGNVANNNSILFIGGETQGGSNETLNGIIDECRISDVVRDSNWIATEYANQNNPLTFNSVGAETANTAGRLFRMRDLDGCGGVGSFNPSL